MGYLFYFIFTFKNIHGYGIWHDGEKKYAFGKWE